MLDSVFKALVTAVDSYYLPDAKIEEFKKAAYDFFILKYQNAANDKILSAFCLDKAIYFIS